MAPTEVSAGLRILVVDDNQDAADSLVMLLEIHGSTARSAYSGVEGLDALDNFKPAVVFLDFMMPGMDGIETARQMRNLPGGQSLKLVALTASPKDDLEDNALNSPFDHHLTKPASFGSLCDLLWCKAECFKNLQTCRLLRLDVRAGSASFAS